MRKNLIGTSSAKTIKGEILNFLTGIMYLAPYTIAGFNVCADASEGCSAACLYNSGRGKFTSTQLARIAKTKYFREDRNGFILNCYKDIQAIERKAKRENMIPCIRLNGTSDLPFENIKLNGKSLMESFSHIQFYDYTKSYKRMLKYLNNEMPKNYHLTFSLSETNMPQAMDVLNKGGNVAMVFTKLPTTYKGYRVIDADLTDLRFLDDTNVICGLTFKGSKKDKLQAIESGFVIEA